MDVSADVAAIVAQAPEWNFAGDCALLDLMKRISQNLHERGEQTSRNLRDFETSVRRADIALDNANNSLRSLQFGQQFVEFRVEEVDDDDFVLPEEPNKKPELPLKSAQELATEFLQNNLQMFRKNFEPVTIEVPDSDDEEGAVNTTTVYRAKNPYDNIPLPYIIGTKQWQEHKYAGLYDSAENSEDEQPEQFSSSSSDEEPNAEPLKSAPKQQIREPPLSDSSSLASLPKEMPAPSQALAPAAAQPVVEAAARNRAQPRPIISMHKKAHESDLFTALRASPPSDDPPSTSSSLNSSPAISQGLSRVDASLSSSSSSASKPIPAGRQSPPKLFVEPATTAPVAAPTPIDVPSEVKPVAAASQIKRKPVNLFNDDEFNSFMSEIVDKVQSKAGNSSATSATVAKPKESPVRTPSEVPQAVNPPVKAAKQPAETPQRGLNLFEDSPPLSPALKPAVAATPAKTLPKSLFDDNLDDDGDDFLSSFGSKAKPPQQMPKTTLFDDDDDLDIDDIFAKKAPPAQPNKLASKLVGKTSLFDDDEDEDVGNANDIFGSKKTDKPVAATEAPPVQRKSLFDDLGDDDLFGTPKSNKKPYAEEQINQSKIVEQYVEEQPPVDAEQLPVQLQPQQQNVAESKDLPNEDIKIAPTPMPRVDLFSDDFSDEETIISSPAQITRDAPATIDRESKEITEEKEEEQVLPAAQAEQKNKDKEELFNKKEEPGNKLQEEPLINKEEEQIEPAPMENIFKDSSETSIAAEQSTAEQEPKAEQKQDPIMSLVAEVSSRQTKPEIEDKKQNYSSLFSDEPPDDSEFFQSLGTSSLSSMSASKMFDSEQDFYEPTLPDLPQSAKATPTAATPVEQPNNDYGGMRLFSDVPPDDDDDDDEEEEKEKEAEAETENAAPAAPAGQQVGSLASTTRIHTIFYDDFSETARAGATAIFDEEPPADVVDRRAASPAPEPPKASPPIKKLQMPNININVQALLPGASATPKLPKKQELDAAPKAAAREPVKSSYGESDNILQCVGKTRVRGPAQRRPSTRRARQANYAKSLLEAQPDPPAAPVPLASNSATLPSFESDDNEDAADAGLFKPLGTAAAAQPAAKTVAKESSRGGASFLDSDPDDDEVLFGKALQRKAAAAPVQAEVPPAAAPAAATILTNPPAAAAAPVALLATQPPEDVRKPIKNLTSFLDSDEDDGSGDLFGATATDPASFATQQPAQDYFRAMPRANTGPPKSYVSFLDNNEDEDALFAAVVAPVALAKEESKATVKPSFLDSDDDDDDALFKPAQPKAGAPPKQTPNEQPAPVAKQEPPKLQALPKSQAKPMKSSASKLFDDSEDDDDDLFGSTAGAVSKQAAAPRPATLFRSSSSEEKEEPPKALSSKNKLPANPSKSLFSDDDDDDDLFGSGGGAKRGAAPRSQAKPKKAVSKVTATPLPASTADVADNPLADLLGP